MPPRINKVLVRGPFWSAQVSILGTEQPRSGYFLRSLFLDRHERREDGRSVLAPGTLLALCWPRRVDIQPITGTTYRWTRPDNATPPDAELAPDAIARGLADGSLALLVLAMDPDRFEPPASDELPELRCVAGEIRADHLPAQNNAATRLYRALAMTAPTAQNPAPTNLVGAVSVHATGATVYGALLLPWEGGALRGPMQLARPNPGGPHQLRLERERLIETDRAGWDRAWQRLARALNPGNPRHAGAAVGRAPAWVTAEVADPVAVPDLTWSITQWADKTGPLPVQVSGDLRLLLADSSPYDALKPPTSLARAGIDAASVRVVDGVVEVTLASGAAPSGNSLDDSLRYVATARADGSWDERLSLERAALAFDPIATASLVRETQGLNAPGWSPSDGRPLEPAVVWGCFRLDDGWAQLPVPNLTERAYVASGRANPVPAPAAARLAGALVLGNDRPAVLARHPDEQAWSLTVTDADALAGRWRLRRSGAELALDTVALEVLRPELRLDGLLWLGTRAPRPEDALPDLDDWVTGLRSIALRSVSSADVFPAVVTFDLEGLVLSAREQDSVSSAALGAWTAALGASGPAFEALVDANVLPAETFGPTRSADNSRHNEALREERPALVWRRHATLPMIAALPLTQTRTPPNHPSASRQLVPFELPPKYTARGLAVPGGARFGVAGGPGAARFPRLLDAASPAKVWRERGDLPLASLSLPGLELAPARPGAPSLPVEPSLQLVPQYRYDLPYLDELVALAQRPPEPTSDTAPGVGDRRPEPPAALAREGLGAHFRALADRAALAALDGSAALRADNARVAVDYAVEPLSWPARLSTDLASYPAQLTLDNAQGPSAPLTLRGAQALAGLSARLVRRDTGLARVADGPHDFELVAGSMLARVEPDGSYRDQRGLSRGGTTLGVSLLHTPVKLAEDASGIELVSALDSLELATGAAPDAERWQLWFRDLPCDGGAFDRARSHPVGVEDVNDPEAGGRARGHRNGYEWRLAPSSASFSLFGLEFFPLTLEKLELGSNGVRSVELIGRLQLPLGDGDEIEELDSAVRLGFERAPAGAGLVLASVGAVTGDGEWPLAQSSGETTDAPRIRWKSMGLVNGGSELEVGGAVLSFVLFEAEWRIPLAPLRFERGTAPISLLYEPTSIPEEPIAPRRLSLEIRRQTGVHRVTLVLGIGIGRGILGGTPAPRANKLAWKSVATATLSASAVARSAFRAEVRFPVLGDVSEAVAWLTGHLFDDVVLRVSGDDADGTLVFTRDALQMSFRSAQTHAGGELQLLPGMHIDTASIPGFATLSWRVLTAPDDVPTLWLETSFLEALITCRWGEFLQDATAGNVSLDRLCGSSAGDLVFGYTGHSSGTAFRETLVANGFLELKNLVSWPKAMRLDAPRRLRLPAASENTPLDHLRHTARVLVNQHELSMEALELSSGELIFRLRQGRSWQFLAVVEHQLLEVEPGDFTPATIRLGSDYRWTVVQEVRLHTPGDFEDFLNEQDMPDSVAAWTVGVVYKVGDVVQHRGERFSCRRRHRAQQPPAQTPDLWSSLEGDDLRVHTLSAAGTLAPVGRALRGYLRDEIRERLAKGDAPELEKLDADTLIVEASAACWIRQQPLADAPPSALQFLPGCTQMGILAGPDDFRPSAASDPRWLLLAMPFLGRLQDRARDGLTSTTPPSSVLQVDPLLYLRRWRPSAPTLVFALSSWGKSEAIRVEFAAFDAAVGRTWARLDAGSLEEALFRLHHPPEERPPAALPSVIATLVDSAGRSSRPAALARAFDSQVGGFGDAHPVWWPESILVHQADAELSSAAVLGWHVTAFVLASSQLLSGGSPGQPRRFAAATQRPAAIERAPISFALSPYLGLERRPAPAEGSTLKLVVAELLCHERASGALRSVTSGVFEPTDTSSGDTSVLFWARESHRRQSPDSPVAVLRLREVRHVQGSAEGQAVLATRYAFSLVPDLSLSPRGSRRVLRLRAPAAQLRFRDGHYGGRRLPDAIRPLELAPPQTVGVQPLHVERVPSRGWPWGLSALRTSVQYSRDALGMVGGPRMLYWQSLAHSVQFRPASGAGAAAGLPPRFRAPAIRSLLPVLPDPPLPSIAPSAIFDEGASAAPWRPVVPGRVRYLLTGARPGAFVTLRAQLQRQSSTASSDTGAALDAVLVSGSLPVQHRIPRPVALPPNDAVPSDLALQPWASPFEPSLNAFCLAGAVDEAYFGAGGSSEARGLRAQMMAPEHGEIGADWDGVLDFELASVTTAAATGEAPPVLEGWRVEVSLQVAGRVASVMTLVPSPAATARRAFALEESVLAELVRNLGPGAELWGLMRVSRSDSEDGFSQTLAFPLRTTSSDTPRLPLEPRFIRFEDPEYNQRLVSSPKRATVTLQTPGESERVLRSVTIAADRGQYNSDSVVAFRYDWDDDARPEGALLRVARIDSNQTVHGLGLRQGVDAAPLLRPRAGVLLELRLADLRDPQRALALIPGETLELRLVLDGAAARGAGATDVVLTLDIVEAHVIPVPRAGYALLRRQQGSSGAEVECARFAWSPSATRIDLIAPDDLRLGVVRRRAVFLWQDTVRTGTLLAHAIQKITLTGSTHVPDLA